MTNKETEISSLGEFAFVERLYSGFDPRNPSTVKGCGDDGAVIDAGTKYTLLSTELMTEGVDFDLTYVPLPHLGYKIVTAGISDILAMNGTPRQILISLGISARFTVEMIEELYGGIRKACSDYEVDLAGGDTTASNSGLIINITAAGEVDKDKAVYRKGAAVNDLICITGDLGAAYMGLHLLEREKISLKGNPDPKPLFEGKEYILQRQLRPLARIDVIRKLAQNGIVPTSMIDLSDGLSSEMLHICKNSDCGARIYLDRIPIASQTYEMASELNADPVVAALNGGEDYELLFTVPLSRKDEIFALGFDIIGHITEPSSGAYLVMPDGSEIALTAQGWR